MLGFGPLSSLPIAALPEWRAYVFAQAIVSAQDSQFDVLYAATVPFISRNSDTPPNQPFAGTLDGSLRVDRTIITGDGYGGFAQNVSELTLINAAGEYDDVVDTNSPNGQEIVCSIGEVLKGDPHGAAVVQPYAQHEICARLIGERWRADRKHLTIELRDHSARLDVPVQTGSYAGTGGLEGAEEIKGQRRPQGFGEVYNATPVLVIANESLWQCHDGAVADITDVKDGGVSLTETGSDHATTALLRAATLVPGQWASCNAEGYFRLGGAAVAQVTVDFTSLYLTTADIIEAATLASTDLTAADLDAWTFERLNDDQPATRSYFLGPESSETCAEMFGKLMRGIGGWHQVTTLGMLQVHRLEAPIGIAAAYFDSAKGTLVDVDRVALPRGLDPPPRRCRVTHSHNWTVQTTLYGQVSEGDPALAAYLATPYKLASTSDAAADAVLADYPQAPDPEPVPGYFAEPDDAQDEAERRLEFYTAGYKPYRFTAPNALFLHQIGQEVNVTDARLGLSNGKYLRLLEVNDDTRSVITEMIGLG